MARTLTRPHFFDLLFEGENFGQIASRFGRRSPTARDLRDMRVFRVFARAQIALRLAISAILRFARVFRVFARANFARFSSSFPRFPRFALHNCRELNRPQTNRSLTRAKTRKTSPARLDRVFCIFGVVTSQVLAEVAAGSPP